MAHPTKTLAGIAANSREYRSLLAAAGHHLAGPRTLDRSAALNRPSVSSIHVSGPALTYVDDNFGGENVLARDLQRDRAQRPGAGVGCNLKPRLSPDGNTALSILYFNQDCTGSAILFNAQMDGMTGMELATAPANAYFELPNFSPEGLTVLYTLVQDDSAGNSNLNANYLGIMTVAGDHISTLSATGLSIYSPELPAWSPDGLHLSYQYDKGVGTYRNHGIATINADGSGKHPVGHCRPRNLSIHQLVVARRDRDLLRRGAA